MLKEQKGITLIALVVTIIVLLILAGVTIAMLTGQNGILTNAQEARETTSQAEAEERINMTLNAIKTEIFAQQVDNKTYSGQADPESAPIEDKTGDKDGLDARIIEIMKLDLNSNIAQASSGAITLDAAKTAATDEAYSYYLVTDEEDEDIKTLYIYYNSTKDNFVTMGSIVLTSTTANATITAATSDQKADL